MAWQAAEERRHAMYPNSTITVDAAGQRAHQEHPRPRRNEPPFSSATNTVGQLVFMTHVRPRGLALTLRANARAFSGGESIFEPAPWRSSRRGSAHRCAATCR